MFFCWNAVIFKYDNVYESNLLIIKIKVNINYFDFCCILGKLMSQGQNDMRVIGDYFDNLDERG